LSQDAEKRIPQRQMANGRCENARCFAIYHLPFHIQADFFSGLVASLIIAVSPRLSSRSAA
jgi:hypothetical protein